MTDIASWTNVSNSFEHGTASPYSTLAASAQYAQGGPFASSEIKQEKPITDPYGVALLTFARANVLATDTGEVVLEALDVSDAVLDSVTTGPIAYATLDVWTRGKLALTLPLGAVTLRIRLLATRTLGSGNSGAAFDDFSLRVFKHLEPVDVLALDFSELPVQQLPTTWQKFHLAYPDLAIPSVLLAAGALSISSPRSVSGQSIAWSDALAHDVGTCIGAFGGGVTSSPSFVFARDADVDLQISGGTSERGAFTAAAGFTVRVVGRVDEVGFASACGVIGRGTAGLGWSMKLNASGQVQAILRGASGTKTATSTSTVHDGAIHALVMVYSAAANTLRTYVDRRGYNETSTASGLGAFTVTTAPLRIGRDLATSDVFPGQIVEVELFESALTEAEVESMWTLGADPTGEIDTYTRAVAAYVDLEPDAAGDVAIACMASDHVAIGHHAASSTTGLATCQAMTNLVASFDFEAASWTLVGVTITKSGGVDEAWDAGTASVQTIAGDGYVEVVASAASVNVLFGLSTTDANVSYETVHYGIDLSGAGGAVHVFESGALYLSLTTHAPGDVFRVERTGTTVTYKKNGSTFYTSGVSSTGALLVDTSLADTGAPAALAGLKLYDDGVSVPLSWTGSVNVTISAAPTATHSIADPTGLARGVTVLSPNTSAGFRHAGITVSSVAKIGVTFWARASTGTPSINLRLLSSAGVVKDTVAVALTTLWARYDVMFDAWDAATATCAVEWVSASGSVTFDLAHVVAVYQPATLAEAQHPTLIPAVAAGTFASGVYATCTRTMMTQWSAEGEIDVAGVATQAVPPVLAAVVEVGKAATVDNRRIVRVDDNSASPELLLYDGGGSLASSSEATAIDWTEAWRLRGRWNRSKTLDNAADAYGGIVVEGSAASAVYGQASAWTDDTAVVADTVLIGACTPEAVRLSAYVSRLTLRTREKLLP